MKQRLTLITVGLLAIAMGSASFAQTEEPSSEAEKPRKSTSRFPKDAEGLNAMAEQAIAEGNGLRLLQTTILLRRQQPYEPRHLVNMARAYALMGRPSSSYNYMLEMQKQGLAYDFSQHPETAALADTEFYQYVNDLLIRAGEAAGEAEAAFEISSKYGAPAALAWDPSREQFLVGTAGSGEVLAVNDSGRARVLLEADEENGPWAIMDIEVDPARNLLWVSSASIPLFEGHSNDNAGKTGLFEYQLDTLEPLGRYIVSGEDGPHELGSIALDPLGHVYAADRKSAVVFRRGFGEDEILPFVADKELNGFRDMAISADGSRIYLADAYRGILVIDPVAGTAALLEGPESLNLAGVQALFQAGGELIMVQSGIKPQRVMALKLDPSGGTVEGVRPMAIALDLFEGISRGTVHGDAIYYLSRNYLAETGAADDDTLVLRTALDAGDTIVAPDMRKFEDETIRKVREHDERNN